MICFLYDDAQNGNHYKNNEENTNYEDVQDSNDFNEEHSIEDQPGSEGLFLHLDSCSEPLPHQNQNQTWPEFLISFIFLLAALSPRELETFKRVLWNKVMV